MGKTTKAGVRNTIQTFTLYGEAGSDAHAEFIHIEDIRSRSQMYDWEIGQHAHRGLFQLVCVASGSARTRLDEDDVVAQGPAVITIPPGVVHAFRFDPGTAGYVLSVGEALLFEWGEKAGGLPTEPLFVSPSVLDFTDDCEAVAHLTGLLGQVLAEFRTPLPAQASMLTCLLRAVILLVARRHSAVVGASRRERARGDLFARFRTLVEANLLAHWPVVRYADALNVTESRLNRLCQAVAGKSAFDVIQERLILESRRRLAYIAAPVSVLAYELGFRDPAYFCRFFKRHTGMTPGAYRQAREAG